MILGIYGAGGLGREILDVSLIVNEKDKRWEKIIFIDDGHTEKMINETEVYSFDEVRKFCPQEADIEIVIAVGEPQVRKIIAEKVKASGYRLATIIHPQSAVSRFSQIGEGVVVQYCATVSSNAVIGDNVILQAYSVAGHDSVIGKNSIISSFVTVAGAGRVGENCYIGLSVPVKEGASIGDNSIIGMGSAVLRDIPDGVIAIGNPARPMKNNETGRVFGKK